MPAQMSFPPHTCAARTESLERCRGGMGPQKLPEQEYLKFPFHTEGVLGLRTALGCPICAARAAAFPHRALRRVEGASLWVEGKSPLLERAGLWELLMPLDLQSWPALQSTKRRPREVTILV